MTLYALDFEGIISAADAQQCGEYRCLECHLPLQLRQGRRQRHFYHTKNSPQCRLYSKSEAHLLLQLQLQALFPKGEIILERPFLSISRIADACWERHKIIFEIQCSLLSEIEAKARTEDYAMLGYTVVWLLDDRIFNKTTLRPTEPFFRTYPCYYVHYQRTSRPLFYDQFELLEKTRRSKKGPRLAVQLTEPRRMPRPPLQAQPLAQVAKRSLSHRLFFHGDLVHKTLLSKKNRPLAIALENWLFLEEAASKGKTSPRLDLWTKKFFFHPLWRCFEWLLQRIDA